MKPRSVPRLALLLIGLSLAIYSIASGLPTWSHAYLPQFVTPNVARLLIVFVGMLLTAHAVLWPWIRDAVDRVIKPIDYAWYFGSLLAVILAIADFEASHRVRLLDELDKRIQELDDRIEVWRGRAAERQGALKEDTLTVQLYVCERIQPVAFANPGSADVEKLCAAVRQKVAWLVFERRVCDTREILPSDLTEGSAKLREPTLEQLVYASTVNRVLVCGRTTGPFDRVGQGSGAQTSGQPFYEVAAETAFVPDRLGVVADTESVRVGFLDLAKAMHVTGAKKDSGERADVLATLKDVYGGRAWMAGIRPLYSTEAGDRDPMPGLDMVRSSGAPRATDWPKLPVLGENLRVLETVDLRLDCRESAFNWLGSFDPGLLSGLLMYSQRMILMVPPDDKLQQCTDKLRTFGPPSGTIRDLGAFSTALKDGRELLAATRKVVEAALDQARSRSDGVAWWPFIVAAVIALRLCKTTAEVLVAYRSKAGAG